jgi:hypothetical protein
MPEPKRTIPMMVPNIGGQTVPFDVSEAVPRHCEACGCQHFMIAVRLGQISAMASKNITGRDQLIKFEVYLCIKCGHEYGQAVPGIRH